MSLPPIPPLRHSEWGRGPGRGGALKTTNGDKTVAVSSTFSPFLSSNSCNSWAKPPVSAFPLSRFPLSAFSLVELLVVISIIGLLAGLAVPALKNLGKSNVTISAARQMLDEVARARQLALSQHTTVYMIFVDANFAKTAVWPSLGSWPAIPAVSNLCDKQLNGYNFVSLRSVGTSPGTAPPTIWPPPGRAWPTAAT